VRTKSLSEGSPEASGSSLNYGGVAPRLGHGARNDLVRTVAKAIYTAHNHYVLVLTPLITLNSFFLLSPHPPLQLPNMATETETRTNHTPYLIDNSNDAIHEALTALTLAHLDLSYEPKHKIIYRSDLPSYIKEGRVTTIGFAGGR
jgi:hypothetical protein